MRRFAQVIKVKPERLEEYKHYHANVWPEVAERLQLAGIRNYSIYYRDGYLFSYYEYAGEDLAADRKKAAALLGDDARVREWNELMRGMQEPLDTRDEGEWWVTMEEVFHLD